MFLLYFCQILGLTAVILPLATGPVFFTGVVVMVTTLALQIFIEWSPARAPSNALGTSINLKADEIQSVRYPDAAMAFSFACGALLTCAQGHYCLAAFTTMFLIFQISRRDENVQGPASFLPVMQSLLQVTRQRDLAILQRREPVFPARSLKSWLSLTTQIVTLFIPLIRKAFE
jgi:hypothetical protein